MIPTVEWKNNKVRMIDQTLLPLKVVYREYSDYHEVISAIKNLVVRGAPAIGVTAAMAVALAAREVKAESAGDLLQKLGPICDEIASARPTAVNLFWAVQRMKAFAERSKGLSVKEIKEGLIREAEAIGEEDIAVNRAMGRYGAEFIRDHDTILTHCNAGSLATACFGTALGVIYTAQEQGKKIKVFADETRPVLQGARLTAWELMQEGIMSP